MHQLPFEILLQVVDLLNCDEAWASGKQGDPTYRAPSVLSLSLTSRYLREGALRQLFSDLAWNILPDDAIREGRDSLFPENRGDLAAFVRRLRVEGDDKRKELPTLPARRLFGLLLEALPRMSELTSLQLNNLPLTAGLVSGFKALEKLRTLIFHDCPVKEEDLPVLVGESLEVKITRLELVAAPQEKADQVLLTKFWMKVLDIPSITSLKVNHVAATILSLEKADLTRVKTLGVFIRWSPVEEEQALDVISRCINLEKIDVLTHRIEREAEPIPLSADAIPNLTQYFGDFGCAEEFIKDRPVHTIHINKALRPRGSNTGFVRPDNVALIRTLAVGSAPVRHLRFGVISWRIELLNTIAELFPELETLRVDDRGPMIFEDWVKDDGTNALKKMPRLHTIRTTICNRWTEKLEPQIDVVRRWEQASPAVREISLTRAETWVRCDPGEWHLLITKGRVRGGPVEEQ